MFDRVYQMPDAEEMMRRLQSANIGVPDGQDVRLYGRICQMAGKELYSEGVVTGLALAVHDYCEGMSPMILPLVNRFIPRFIDAIVIDDEDVRRDAHAFLERAEEMRMPELSTERFKT